MLIGKKSEGNKEASEGKEASGKKGHTSTGRLDTRSGSKSAAARGLGKRKRLTSAVPGCNLITGVEGEGTVVVIVVEVAKKEGKGEEIGGGGADGSGEAEARGTTKTSRVT